jgi:uncharacterized metal-binding protein YceD (DUF177 family)
LFLENLKPSASFGSGKGVVKSASIVLFLFENLATVYTVSSKVSRKKMSEEVFKIYIRRLAEGKSEHVKEIISPQFLDLQEEELQFPSPVKFELVAEVADQALLLSFKIETEALLPCAICNEPTQVLIAIPSFLHTEELSSIKGDIFNFRECLREAILLELPQIAECHQGNCPERENLKHYFAKPKELLFSGEESFKSLL